MSKQHHHNKNKNNNNSNEQYQKPSKDKQKKVKFEVKKVFSNDEYAAVELEFAEKHVQQQQVKFTCPANATVPLTPASAQIEDCVAGSIWGLAYGDVIGCPVEGMKWPQIKTLYNDSGFNPQHYSKKPQETIYDPNVAQRPYFNSVPVKQLDAHHLQLVGGLKYVRHMRPIGLHSDDTQQALALVNCCLEQPKIFSDCVFSVDIWKDYVVQGWQTNAWRGIGKNFTDSSKKLYLNQATPKSSGADSAGIGAAMRIGSLGAILCKMPVDLLATIAFETTLMTHGTIPAAAMAFACAYAAHQFCNLKSAKDIIQALPLVVKKYESEWQNEHQDWQIHRPAYAQHIVSTCIATAVNAIESHQNKKPIAAMLHHIREVIGNTAKNMGESAQFNKKIEAFHVNQGLSVLGGVHGLCMALLPEEAYEKDPTRMILDICKLGYDTDTVAAITGSLLGARFGTRWINKDYMLDKERIQKYADQMIKCAVAQSEVQPAEHKIDMMKRESIMSQIEHDFQSRMKKLTKPSSE